MKLALLGQKNEPHIKISYVTKFLWTYSKRTFRLIFAKIIKQGKTINPYDVRCIPQTRLTKKIIYDVDIVLRIFSRKEDYSN